MIRTLKDFGKATDFNLLRLQKSRLLEILDEEDNNIYPEQHEAVEGIISFINSFQVLMVDSGEFSEEEIFGNQKENDG